MPNWQRLRASLLDAGLDLTEPIRPRAVGGGDINAAWRVETDSGRVFLKTGSADALEMFAAEAEGLETLSGANAVRVPAVLAYGACGADSFLALEWIDFEGHGAASTDRLLGVKLAAQHRVFADAHGWHRDNTIGSTPQINTWTDDWTAFYREHRLRFQLELAKDRGYRGALEALGDELEERLPALIGEHEPEPSLLHGDLWGGNHASAGGEPVIFDPAVYYGDRETDLAMTRLFGGFSHAFYEAYELAWPLREGHERRLGLYQLYHVLNHLNLFGRGYLGRAETLMREAIAAAS